MNSLLFRLSIRSLTMCKIMNLLICLTFVEQCQAEDLSGLSANIQRYAKFHFSTNEEPIKNDFYASMQSIHSRFVSSINEISSGENISSDIYLLPDEVVLIRNALSESEQKLLFDSLAPSVSQSLSPVQIDSSLCPNCECTLHRWELNEMFNQSVSKAIATLGEVLYLKAASFLNIQQAIRTKNNIVNSLHAPPAYQRPSFKYLHGVLYGMNDTLGLHLDKTWSMIANSPYEWVVSISLGHSAMFRYRKNSYNNEETTPGSTTEIVLNSGDLIFFNGAYLEHSMPYILKNKYPMWWYSSDKFRKARLNIQYRLLGEENFHQSQSNINVISSQNVLSPDANFSDAQYERLQSLPRTDNMTTIQHHEYKTVLKESNKESVVFSTLWMNRIFSLTQSNHEKIINMPTSLNVTGFATMRRNYWPFTLDEQLNNQRLAIMGIRGLNIDIPQDHGLLKKLFYKSLFDIQKLSLPIESNEIVMSFSDPSIVLSLHAAGLLRNPADFDSIFSTAEISHIKRLVHEAMVLINQTDLELYRCIIQSVSTLAFYKYANPNYIGGTISSAIGLIWLDPSNKEKWTVEMMAEQIVHEFIHTSLFINELVHTSYSNYNLLRIAVVKSAIRQQLRHYDKSFHAAYVAAGLVAFLAKAGVTVRAEQLVANLESSINELEAVAIHTDVLSASGRTILRALKSFFNEAVRRGIV